MYLTLYPLISTFIIHIIIASTVHINVYSYLLCAIRTICRRRETRSLKEANTFAHELKCICTRRQTCSHKEENTIAHKHTRSHATVITRNRDHTRTQAHFRYHSIYLASEWYLKALSHYIRAIFRTLRAAAPTTLH